MLRRLALGLAAAAAGALPEPPFICDNTQCRVEPRNASAAPICVAAYLRALGLLHGDHRRAATSLAPSHTTATTQELGKRGGKAPAGAARPAPAGFPLVVPPAGSQSSSSST